MLVLSNANEVIGNFVMPNGFTYDEVIQNISELGLRPSIIFYSNQNNYAPVKEIRDALKEADIPVLDFIVTDSAGTGVQGMYKSYADEGLLAETQAEYGTNSISQDIQPSAIQRGAIMTQSSISSKETLEVIKDLPNSNNVIKSKIEGSFLTKKQASNLQKEIEANYDTGVKFGQESNDIRQFLYNYDNPYAEKTINGVNLRIAEGLTEGIAYSGNRRRTWLLYADGEIVGKFYSPKDIMQVVKFIEDNLIKQLPTISQDIQPSAIQRGQMTVNGQQVQVKPLPEGTEIVNGFYSPIEKNLRETKVEKQSANSMSSLLPMCSSSVSILTMCSIIILLLLLRFLVV